MTDKVFPHSLESEEAVLGSLLIDSSAYYTICNDLRPDDFYRDKNCWIYEARQKLDVCDQVTMAHQLERDGRLEAIGGAAYLSHLIAHVATSVHIEYYADILRKMGNARRLIRAGARISDLGYEQKEDGVSEALKEVLSLKGKNRDIVSPEDLSEFALGYYDGLANGDITPIRFGIKTLDLLGGMQPGELVVLGAETEMGKTTWLNQIARNQKGPVLFCTTEMTRAQWSQREVARIMRIRMEQLGNPFYLKAHKREWLQAVEDMKKSNLHILVGSVTTKQIYAEAANLPGCCLIIIDYLQRLKGVRATYESVSSASREIADMAKSLETPVILSSQLSRDSSVGKDGKVINRPLLTRLKDSGNIENDSDWVMFIKRNKEAKHNTPEFLMAELIVEKHKQGGNHPTVKLKFNVESQTYEEVI
jgi:replicative DNA helicase